MTAPQKRTAPMGVGADQVNQELRGTGASLNGSAAKVNLNSAIVPTIAVNTTGSASESPNFPRNSNFSEARRLLAAGMKLCELLPGLKQPVGDGWNVNTVTSVRADAGGYGLILAANGLCSIDFDNDPVAVDGLLKTEVGMTAQEIRDAGVWTTSTRPGSGGRVTFRAPAGAALRWLSFSGKAAGTVLELRATSANLQDTLPGTTYMSKTGGPWRQDYHPDCLWALGPADTMPELPEKLLQWWLRCSTDVEFLREQQRRLVGADANLAVSAGDGSLAFASPYRGTYVAAHGSRADVEAILIRHGYTKGGRDRLAPSTATGAPCVRLIPGKDDLWQSDHQSDPLVGAFDAWTAYVVLEHDGDLAAAEAAFGAAQAAAAVEGFEDNDVELFSDDVLARREAQRQLNREMQNVDLSAHVAQPLTLPQMLDDCVLIEEGSLVGRLSEPRHVLSLAEFRIAMAASKTRPPSGRDVPTVALWVEHKDRVAVKTRTFAPGADRVCLDPDGKVALNTWLPVIRTPASVDVTPLLEHVDYLFADESGPFLDWLAHIEQRPGVLPHYGWLHIAQHTGTGRNWLASVLARLWRGYVAPNLDLNALLESQFNAQLARAVLAVVDEIHEGGTDNYHRNANRLKSLINAETRRINPKYGRDFTVFNTCRWLVFSNKLAALAIDDTDRRWRVMHHAIAPRAPTVYERLYGLLEDSEFINAVGVYLRDRDISGFKPGERPPMTEAKKRAIGAALPMVSVAARELVDTWPADIITNAEAARELSDGAVGYGFTSAMRRALSDYGAMQREKAVKIAGQSERVWVLRNHIRWMSAVGVEVAAHVLDHRPAGIFGEPADSCG